jgi:hypothetical protein
MNKIALILSILVSSLTTMSQSLGDPELVTLSDGTYLESHDNDSVVRIGSALFNVRTKQVVGIDLSEDTISDELEEELMGRWLAIDPLAVKYPSLSVYNFVRNSPLVYVDPDGRKIKPINGGAEDAVKILYDKYKDFLQIDVTDDNVYSSNRFELTMGSMANHIKEYNKDAKSRNKDIKKYNKKHKNDESFKAKPMMTILSEDDTEEATKFFKILSKQEITEVMITETSDGKGHFVRGGSDDSQEGSDVLGDGVVTQNAQYNKIIKSIKKVSGLNKPIAEAVFEGKTTTLEYWDSQGQKQAEELTITAKSGSQNGNSAYFENKIDKRPGQKGYTEGILVIDGTNKTDAQNSQTILNDAPKK